MAKETPPTIQNDNLIMNLLQKLPNHQDKQYEILLS